MEEYVFLHGLGQTSKSWDNMRNNLTIKNSHYVNLFDISNSSKINYNNIYSNFEKKCEQYDSINLCGLSLGAIIAINYAIEHPSKTNTLVLIAPQYKVSKLVLALQNIIFRMLSEDKFKSIGLSKNDLISLINSMSNLDFSKELSNIVCPTLIICGKKDIANTIAAKSTNKILSDSKLCFINGVSHEINIEAPDKLAEMLCTFWRIYE